MKTKSLPRASERGRGSCFAVGGHYRSSECASARDRQAASRALLSRHAGCRRVPRRQTSRRQHRLPHGDRLPVGARRPARGRAAAERRVRDLAPGAQRRRDARRREGVHDRRTRFARSAPRRRVRRRRARPAGGEGQRPIRSGRGRDNVGQGQPRPRQVAVRRHEVRERDRIPGHCGGPLQRLVEGRGRRVVAALDVGRVLARLDVHARRNRRG